MSELARAFFVHIGPAAIRAHGGWVGYASGNRPCAKVRKTAKSALRDARRKEDVMTDYPEAVREYEEWHELWFGGAEEGIRLADAAIAALQEMVEDLSLGYDAANKVGIERAEQAEADVKYAVGQLEIERRENQLGAERYLQAEAELAELNDAYSRLLSGNGELKDRLDKVEAQKRGLATAAQTGMVAADRVIELEDEVARLKHDLAKFPPRRERIAELEGEIATMRQNAVDREADLALKDRMLEAAVDDLSGELYGYPCDDKHLAGWLADLARRAKEAGE